MNKKKYFPSDDEEDFDLQDETPHSAYHLRENSEDPRAAGKENYYRQPQVRERGHGAGSNHQSDKLASPPTRFGRRER